jgi:predicted  nucleic acid-binding Zn-ribbon protein
LDRVRERLAKAEDELKTEISIENLEAALKGEEERLQDVEQRQRASRVDAEARQTRSETLETQLYDGSMTSVRDLEALQEEAASVRQSIDRDEALFLELSIQLEDSQTKCAELGSELAEIKSQWEIRQVELTQLIEGLAVECKDYESQRTRLIESVDQASLQRYETLRRSKRGLAVARVERGLCQGCRMALPTHLQQRVRSGRQTVNCSSCGRMLFPS